MNKTAHWQNLQRRLFKKKKNSLRGHNPRTVSIPQLLRETIGIQPHEIVQKDCTNEETSPNPNGVNYPRPLKVSKAERF
jgi:hypothetical protein